MFWRREGIRSWQLRRTGGSASRACSHQRRSKRAVSTGGAPRPWSHSTAVNARPALPLQRTQRRDSARANRRQPSFAKTHPTTNVPWYAGSTSLGFEVPRPHCTAEFGAKCRKGSVGKEGGADLGMLSSDYAKQLLSHPLHLKAILRVYGSITRTLNNNGHHMAEAAYTHTVHMHWRTILTPGYLKTNAPGTMAAEAQSRVPFLFAYGIQ